MSEDEIGFPLDIIDLEGMKRFGVWMASGPSSHRVRVFQEITDGDELGGLALALLCDLELSSALEEIDGETLFSVAEDETGSLVLPNLVMSEDGMSATIREGVIVEALLRDCSDEDAERAKSRFVPQALAPFATPRALTEDNFGRVPRVYIETLQDRAVSPSFQKEMYDRVPCQNVVSTDTSHSPFFSAPEELAGHLEVLARG